MLKLAAVLFFVFAVNAFAALVANAEMVPTEALITEQEDQTLRRGGAITSIGTDTYDVRTQTAWFYGEKPVVVCFNSLADFGFSSAQLTSLLDRSFARWKDYFRAKGISASGGGGAAKAVNLNFALKGKCKGDEDLVFHFGTGPIFGNMQDLKAGQTLGAPLAYANKTAMERDMTWSKGYIRIVAGGYYSAASDSAVPYPNWRKPGALEAIVVHEIGHLLGFMHTPHTIMSGEYVESQMSGPAKAVAVTIDGEKQLVTCSSCREAYVLKRDSASGAAASESNTAFFTGLGLDKKRAVKLVKDGARIVLSDGKNERVLGGLKESKIESRQTLVTNFPGVVNDRSVASNFYGRFETGDRKVPVLIEYNSIERGGDLLLHAVVDDELKLVGAFTRE